MAFSGDSISRSGASLRWGCGKKVSVPSTKKNASVSHFFRTRTTERGFQQQNRWCQRQNGLAMHGGAGGALETERKLAGPISRLRAESTPASPSATSSRRPARAPPEIRRPAGHLRRSTAASPSATTGHQTEEKRRNPCIRVFLTYLLHFTCVARPCY